MDDLLVQTLPYVELPELRPVALEVLKRHPKIPSHCLELIAANPELLDACGSVPLLMMLSAVFCARMMVSDRTDCCMAAATASARRR
jgi:hypothetical protein